MSWPGCSLKSNKFVSFVMLRFRQCRGFSDFHGFIITFIREPALARQFGNASALAIFIDEFYEGFASWATPRLDSAGHSFCGLNEHIWIECHPQQVIGPVAGNERLFPNAPVIGQTDLVDRLATGTYRFHPLGDQDPGLYGTAR